VDAQVPLKRPIQRARTLAVLERDPDLGQDLEPDGFELACRRVVAAAVNYRTGPWPAEDERFGRGANLGLLVIEGLLVRGVTVGDYTCAELLGPGDVLQPWLRVGPDESVATEVDWNVVEPVTVAILDEQFIQSAAPWPGIYAAVARRLMQRSHWLGFHLAVCGLRRIEERLLIVLWHFADRWGTVTREGVRLDLRLTHEVLAAVIGARRPSVSAAAKSLITENRVRSLRGSRWLLLGRPPAELRSIHESPRGRADAAPTSAQGGEPRQPPGIAAG
jgi:CRP/FNR family transcriptional regulator, cyclic AMP receptor protein